MRTRRSRTVSVVVTVVVLLWLLIGVIAAFQRGYFQGSEATCARTSTILVTVLAGPVLATGRRELLTVLREQAVSRTRHRFGHLQRQSDA